ncbi:MAG: hypothetical protein HCA25_05575 [Dolichospermum sp. DET50]|nr:hypothetical protein [Dolichospermum sp. DET66]MBS3031763.1 hypothetical protein [Dolichospermum sp. DET67]MBS3036974.1 hypothetical protein [Dolichospermum sp. DET50]QSX68986.1 MAG: hypothetical protein EZY12_04740 [Dolichospermum sp. DET69]
MLKINVRSQEKERSQESGVRRKKERRKKKEEGRKEEGRRKKEEGKFVNDYSNLPGY